MSVALTSASAPVNTTATPAYEFDESFQTKVAALQILDTSFARKTEGLIEPGFFTNEVNGLIVQIAQDFYKTYKKTPGGSTLGTVLRDAVGRLRLRKETVEALRDQMKTVLRTDLSDRAFIIDKIAEFAQQAAMENAVLRAAEMLESKKPDFKAIKTLIDKAQAIGVMNEGLGYDYWEEIANRTKKRIDIAAGVIKPDGISTGLPELDKCLFHKGWGRRELSLLMGPPKSGKSALLGNFSINANRLGFNVLLISKEVGAEILADRFDADVASHAFKTLGINPHAVQTAVDAARKNTGIFKIHEFASGSLKVSALKRLVESYRNQGVVFDLITVDYADIMCPEERHDQTRDDLRQIYIDLRALGFEQNAAMLSATQTNRDGMKAMTAKAEHAAEDINKIRTADIVISINATDAEKATGEARLFFAASRNTEEMQLLIKQDREKFKFIEKILGRV